MDRPRTSLGSRTTSALKPSIDSSSRLLPRSVTLVVFTGDSHLVPGHMRAIGAVNDHVDGYAVWHGSCTLHVADAA